MRQDTAALRDFGQANDRLGSFFDRSTRPRPARNVRFTSKSVQTLAHNETSRRAHRVLTRRSKAALIQSPYLVGRSCSACVTKKRASCGYHARRASRKRGQAAGLKRSV